MAKIKEIVKKLEDNSYERISLGVTSTSELVNDSGFITNEELIANQADWNENDSAAASYVKNRTHYEENIKEESFHSATLTTENWELRTFEEKEFYTYSFNDIDTMESLNLQGGEYLNIKLGDQEFLVEIYRDGNDVNYLCAGNPYLIRAASFGSSSFTEDNGLPFGIYIRPGSFMYPWIRIATYETYEYIEYALERINIVKLDNQFLDLENINLSELNNDIGFITKDVKDLVAYYDVSETYNKEEIDTNYYKKSQTYSQNEINNLLNAITTLDIQVVTELPTENISSTTIYLKGSETTGANDYEEWIYANNDWELIGTTAVDLSNYYNKTETDEQFAKLSLYGDTTINVGRKEGTGIGTYSNALGYHTTASDFSAHAEGASTTASGYAAHAEGSSTSATLTASHAEGERTLASGLSSHAEGTDTVASGGYSHAEGRGTIAAGSSQHAQGRWNISESTGSLLHIIGNGTSKDARSNAHTLDRNGNAWFSGDVYVKSTSGTNKDEGSKRLITEEEVTNMLGSVGGDISLSDPLAYEAIV